VFDRSEGDFRVRRARTLYPMIKKDSARTLDLSERSQSFQSQNSGEVSP